VIYKFATIGGRKALLHLTQKPLVVVDQTLHSLDYKAFRWGVLAETQGA
jgi:hypothetical protein